MTELTSLTQVEPYDGRVLFHGPKFQVLRGVEGVSEAGAVATIARTVC
ncbi:MAG: hypothetical protein U0165_05210 [Polyangiaceae bacterium]